MSLFCFLHAVRVIVSKQIEKVQKGIQGEKSSKEWQVRGIWFQQYEYKQVPKVDETRCPEG